MFGVHWQALTEVKHFSPPKFGRGELLFVVVSLCS